MTESNLMRLIMKTVSPVCRIFRNNTGTAWQGVPIRHNNAMTLKNPRPVHFGLCKGSSDLIGWTPITITPEYLGKTLPVFTAIEVKTKTGKPTTEQINFLNAVASANGIAIIARDADDTIRILAAVTTGQTECGRVHSAMPRPR